MLKRTKGRLLLTLLVITGLAGTLKNTTLSQAERKTAITSLKESRADLLKSVKGLSEKQLRFKPSTKVASIEENIYQLMATQKQLWQLLQSTMNMPATPENRSEIKISDRELMTASSYSVPLGSVASEKTWRSTEEAITAFKNARTNQVRYVKTTTEDLRNHPVRLTAGWVDSYQLVLLLAENTRAYTQRIEALKSHPRFPAR